MTAQSRARRDERGQILVIVAVGLVAMVAMVGLIIDGGNAWGQQRKTQNGADAMAEAGATVIAAKLKGASKTDGDVGCLVATAATQNGITGTTAYYTDVTGTFLPGQPTVGACGSGGAIPLGAAGVKAVGQRQFNTVLMRVVGFSQLTSSATATAVAGTLSATCPASAGCPVLPVTFPFTAVMCDGTNRQIQIGTSEWPLVDPAAANASNEVIIPLCTTGPGAVGWIDYGCGGNLAQSITNPCAASIPIPSWIHTSSGNPNNVDSEVNSYAGPVLTVPDDTIVLIPINDNTCNTDPGANQPNCPGGNGSGNGQNFYYHIPYFAGFMIDRAYIQGNNRTPCNNPPGNPSSGGNGATSCFKGWFVSYVTSGTVGSGATGPQDPAAVGIQLIR
jgi:Flp pilus assembly protein TadG